MQNKLTNTVRRPLSRVNAFTLTACIAVMGLTSVPSQANIVTTDTVTTRIDGNLLKSENGARHVYKKLSKRAKRACTTAGHQTLRDRRINDACAVDLLDNFIVDLDDARVTAFHQREIAE